mmetsp:Transcript_21375/g.52364  ORF Transcript_21375/g.52364 Transcript_21375/m.52364 type:complete len:112 (-) Transcript_21375:168-503(-)
MIRRALLYTRMCMKPKMLCTLSDTSRESELFWNSKNKDKTDTRIPRKISEIPDHAKNFEKMSSEEYAESLAETESRLHVKPKGKEDRDVWNALSRARKYQLEKGIREKKSK